MKRKIAALVCAFAVVCTSWGTGGISQVEAAPREKAVGTTYYFSSEGDNANDGTSEKEAWQSLEMLKNVELQPGDQVLLKKGSVFQGYIHLKDVQGTKEAPIKIGSYGEGAKPIINTNGQGIWYQNYGKRLDSTGHKYQGYVSSSILLFDSEYIEISGLEITNEAPDVETHYNANDVMNRTGVAAVAQNKGTIDHIYLDDLYVHDVIGNVYDKHMNNGGIYFTVAMPENEAETGIAKYDDVKIENCYVDYVNRWGIAVGYTYNWDKFTSGVISDSSIEKYGSTNVEIRNNYVKDVGGDAITLMYCDRPLVEYNVSDGVARQINDTDYSQSINGGKVAAAIWPWKCKDAVFQYNEAFDTCQNHDGQAWDADYGDGTVYQYNYSHNNGGGSVMFCGGQAINNIFRYNISQNDLSGAMNPAGQPDAHVYNNVFIMKENVPFIRPGMGGGPMIVENNIIYYTGESPREENWFSQTNADRTRYSNNIYYNYTNTPSNDANAITEDPMFVNPGSAPTEATALVHDRTQFDGYKLKEGSPAINAGKYIPNNGGLDFFGNEIKGMSIDIGVHQTNTPTQTVLLAVYSNVYNVTADTIEDVNKRTTVAEFKKNLIYDERIDVKVLSGEDEMADDAIVSDGMKVIFAHGENAKEYTIVVPKVYVEYDPAGMTAEVGSFQPNNSSEGGGNLALDNDLATMWHTSWNGCKREETWIAIDMKETKEFSMLKYVPRGMVGTGGTNGMIKAYEIYVSDDGNNWGEPIATGTWSVDATVKYAEFDMVSARYVKLVATDSASNSSNIYASAAEIRVGYEEVE